VYPNPFTETININGIAVPFRYSITDLAGRNLISGESGNKKIAIPDALAPGMYLLNLKTATQSTTLKIWRK